MALKHNKKLNAPLVREMLVREMGSSVMRDDHKSARKCYFFLFEMLRDKDVSILLDWFDALSDARGTVDRDSAGKWMERATSVCSMTEERKNAVTKKMSSISESISKCFGEDFFDRHRVTEYKLYASANVYMLNSMTKKSLSQITEMMKHENTIVEALVRKDSTLQKRDERVDGLVCSFMHESFNKNFMSNLSAEQKSVLDSYVKSTLSGDKKLLAKKLDNEREKLLIAMVEGSRIDEVLTDRNMRERLSEAVEVLEKLDTNEYENAVQNIMLFQNLVTELKS